MQQLDLSQARSAVQTGGILSANLRPEGSRFVIEFETRSGPAVLISTNSKRPRPFSPLKAFEAIRELGLESGRFTLSQWRPEEGEKKRPDRAEALKKTHQAAAAATAHDTWFREQVEQGLREADDPKTVWISQEDASAAWAKKREELQQRFAEEGTA